MYSKDLCSLQLFIHLFLFSFCFFGPMTMCSCPWIDLSEIVDLPLAQVRTNRLKFFQFFPVFQVVSRFFSSFCLRRLARKQKIESWIHTISLVHSSCQSIDA